MRFHDPHLLGLLALLPLWAWWLWRRARQAPALRLGHAAQYAALPVTWRVRASRHLPWLRILILALLLLALARPQTVEREMTRQREGVDLMLVMDLSTSMLAEDRQAGATHGNRLTMARAVLADFLKGRPGDRVGLVAFAARPYPAAPLTLDHAWLRATVARLRPGDIEDGTALGDAILMALNRLRGTSGHRGKPGRAIILVTDGRDNAGTTSPELAAAAAKTLGIRIHSVGIGARGQAVIPVDDPFGGTHYRQVRADLDEETLRQVSSLTGGAYFRADDRHALARVFQAIDQLEKAPIQEKVHDTHREWYPFLLLGALAFGLIELTLRAVLLRRLT